VMGNPYLDMMWRRNVSSAQKTFDDLFSRSAWPIDVLKKASNTNTQNIYSLLLYPEEYFKGPVISNVTVPAYFNFLKEAQGQKNVDRKKEQNATAQSQANNEVPKETTKGADEAKHRKDATLFLNYTRMRHFEERFGPRQGSMGMLFNPYLLPGYSFVSMDKDHSRMHLMGYVTSISHTISGTGGWSTQAQYAYGRTLKENYEIAVADLFRDKVVNNTVSKFYATAPRLPIVPLADTLQVEDEASKYFKRVFYQKTSSTKDFVFKFAKYFKTTTSVDGVVVPSNAPVTSADTYEIDLQFKTEVVNGEEQFRNTDVFTDYNKAMQRVSRPICSLRDYVSFINGGVASDTFFQKNVIPAEVYGVAVPFIIRNYTAGDTDRYIQPTSELTQEQVEGVQDLRRDWVSSLLRYRNAIYERKFQ